MQGAAATLRALGVVILGISLPAAALARSDENDEVRKPRPHRSAEILLDMSDAARSARDENGAFHIRKHYGFEYAHRFDSAPVTFSVQGPALPRKRVGLCFELRF